MKVKVAGVLSWFLFLILIGFLIGVVGGRLGYILAGLAPFLFIVPIRYGIFRIFKVEDLWFKKIVKVKEEQRNEVST